MPRLRFEPSDAEVVVPDGTRLIDAIRAAGLPIAHPCGDELICGKCGVRILEGEGALSRESAAERDAKQRNRIPLEYRLACALRVRGDLVVQADYWGVRR